MDPPDSKTKIVVLYAIISNMKTEMLGADVSQLYYQYSNICTSNVKYAIISTNMKTGMLGVAV